MLYTKGPWRVAHTKQRGYGLYKIYPFNKIEKRYLLYDDPFDLPIRTLRDNNAKLIAKSPEMYEQIKKLIADWKVWDDEAIADTLNFMLQIIEEIEK